MVAVSLQFLSYLKFLQVVLTSILLKTAMQFQLFPEPSKNSSAIRDPSCPDLKRTSQPVIQFYTATDFTGTERLLCAIWLKRLTQLNLSNRLLFSLTFLINMQLFLSLESNFFEELVFSGCIITIFIFIFKLLNYLMTC